MFPFRPAFTARATTLLRVAVAAVVLLLATSAFGVWQYYHSPYWSRVGLAPNQPVLFSHRHHAGELRIDCRFCHATVETSAFAGMPTTQTCLNCHSQLFTDTAMLAPVVRSAATQQPLAWSRVTRLPDHVFFHHGVHVAAGVSCISCHGELGRMALTAKAEPLDMRECLACHRDPAPHLQPQGEVFAALRPATPAGTADASSPAWSAHEAARDHLLNCSTCHH
jgi:hypothetical protein